MSLCFLFATVPSVPARYSFPAPAGRVVWAQSIILTVSAAGFLVYQILKHYRGSRQGMVMQIISGVICMLSIWMMTGNRSERSLLIWGCVFFLFAGMFGSMVHDQAADILKNRIIWH